MFHRKIKYHNQVIEVSLWISGAVRCVCVYEWVWLCWAYIVIGTSRRQNNKCEQYMCKLSEYYLPGPEYGLQFRKRRLHFKCNVVNSLSIPNDDDVDDDDDDVHRSHRMSDRVSEWKSEWEDVKQEREREWQTHKLTRTHMGHKQKHHADDAFVTIRVIARF